MNAESQTPDFWRRIMARADVWFSFSLLSVILILVLPLPSMLIDMLLCLSVMLAVLIILTVSNMKEPSQFSVFPTVLLFVTLFRLGLNVATTRAILTGGDAGNLINAFGQFVVSGNVIVGLIIFVILTLINFIVITKGAGRVAEVAARFTLDAMPGKQMSIDSDLNAGIISEKEARQRRKKLEDDATFFGAMDGSSKFVRGDAVAGIFITAINLVGGFAVGILQMDLTASESVKTFTLLSVGDGLVSQIPALIISTAAGILVTRSNSRVELGKDIAKQIFGSQQVVLTTGVLLWLLMLMPGFPSFVLFVLGGILIGVAVFFRKFFAVPDDAEKEEEGTVSRKESGKEKKDVPAAKSKKSDILALELGLDLLPLVHGNVKNVIDRIASLRRNLSLELGIMIPSVAVRDNSGMPPHRYRLLLRGHEIASSDCYVNHVLAMGVGSLQRPLRGRKTVEPAFGMDATWIPESDRVEAERLGYAVVDPLSVLTTHLSETLKNNAAELLSRQEVQKLLDDLKETDEAVIQEMSTLQVGIGVVHRVLQNLLRERIPIGNLAAILEKLCDQVILTKNVDELSEACRKVLSHDIAKLCDIQDGTLRAITFQAELEQSLFKAVRQTPQDISLAMDPAMAHHLHDELKTAIEQMTRQGYSPLLLCSPSIRLGLKKFFTDTFVSLQVVAYNEISPKVQLLPAYTILFPDGVSIGGTSEASA